MKNQKFLFLILIPLHLILVTGLWFTEFSYFNILFFLLGYIFIGGLGVEIGLHRWASHRSIKLNKISEYLIIVASLLSCQGHPIWWATIHRRYHHKNTDTAEDIHSPNNGKWNSFLGWIIKHDPTLINYKHGVDLLNNRIMRLTSKYYELIVLGIWLIIGILNINFLLWFLIIPTVISFHGVGIINTFCHSKYGYRNFNTKDNSTNIPILGWLLWGNGWHNNHHHDPSSFDFGRSISNRKWEFDPCTLILPVIKK